MTPTSFRYPQGSRHRRAWPALRSSPAGASSSTGNEPGVRPDAELPDPRRLRHPGPGHRRRRDGPGDRAEPLQTAWSSSTRTSTSFLTSRSASRPRPSDGLTYTFTLRKDVTFSNGDKFTSKDVLYSWNRAAAMSGYGTSYGDNLSAIDGYDTVSKNTAGGRRPRGSAREERPVGDHDRPDGAGRRYTVQVKLAQPGRLVPYGHRADRIDRHGSSTRTRSSRTSTTGGRTRRPRSAPGRSR